MSQFLKFEVNLESFIEQLQDRLQNNEKKIQTLLAQKSKTYANFVKPLEMLDEYLEQFFTPLSHLNSVNNSEQTQEVYTQALPILTEYSTKLSQNLDIYNAYKEIERNEKNTLNKEQKRVLELTILDFELSGAHLDKKSKKRLQEINLRLSELSNEFSQNLLDATNAFSYIIEDKKDVEGVPQSDLANAEFTEDGITKYKFTLQMPSYLSYMTYGPNSNIREILYKAYTTRAPQNAKIIEELLQLKNEMSHILGFENYANYSLATKMAPNTQAVFSFLHTLLENSTQQAKVELKELEAFAQQPLQSYDTAYFSEKLKVEKYDIDEELYRPYFEQNSVVNGMFHFLKQLFGIDFKEIQETLWHEKAKAYHLLKDGKVVAKLYTDLEARESKRGGAWMHNWQSHCTKEDGEKQLASAFIVTNFPPSTQQNPSLLRHDDVVTLFHEMGHTLHHLLSEVDENSISGVNGVEWDAVEYPSQFLENFAYEPKVLQIFAKHYQSGEIIPDEMIEKLVRSKNFQSALAMLRQLEFSLFDFTIHTKQHTQQEVQEVLDSIREKTALIKPPKYNKFQNGFAHIFAGGYSAGYYSYKWAEVLSADSFFNVVDEGIFHSQTAQKYADIILKNGGISSMQQLFFELHNREVDPTALLRLSGIK